MSYFTERAKQLGINVPAAGERKAGESYFQQRARELGLNIDAPGQQQAAVAPVSNFFTDRQMDLGIIPDTRHTAYHDKVDTTDLRVRPAFDANMTKPATSPVQQQLGMSIKPQMNTFQQQQPVSSDLLRSNNTVRADASSEPKAKSKGVAAVMSSDLGAILDGVTGGLTKPLTKKFENYITNDNAATRVVPGQINQKKLEIGKQISGGIGDLAFGAGTFRGANALTAPVVSKLPGLAEKALGPLASRLAPAAGALTRIGAQTVAKTAGIAATGAAAGALYQAPKEVTDAAYGGKQSFGGRLKDIGEVAALGGAGDVALHGVGSAFGKILKRDGLPRDVAEPKVPKAEPITEDESKTKSNWFTNLFGNQSVGIRAGSQADRSGTGMQIVKNPLKNDAQGMVDQAKQTARAIKHDYVDNIATLKHIGGDVQEVAYDARRANGLADSWIHDKAVTPEGQVVGNSLKDVIGAVPRGQGNAFDDYLVVRHAPYRVARGEMVYDPKLEMNDVDKLKARQSLLEKRHPEFKQLGKEWDKYQGNLLNAGKNFGLISGDQVKAMRTENPHYASNRRQFSKSEKYASAIGANQGFSGQRAPIKDVSPTGSVRKIVSPVRTAIEATGAWMNAGMRNRVMQSILERVKADPEGMKGIVELVPETAEMKAASIKEINDALKNGGMEGLTEHLDSEFSGLFNKEKVSGSKTDNIVTAMVDGQPVKMRVVNPEIFKVLSSLSPQDMGIVMGTFRMLSNATKSGATGTLAPLFAAKGLTMDTPQALIQSKNPFYHSVDLVHAFFSSFANKLPKGTKGAEALRSLARDFKRTGGEYSAALRGDRPLNRSVGSIRREAFLSPKGIAKGTAATIKAPFKALKGFADVFENMNRIAAYKGELRRGDNVRTPENVRRAMRESQEITTNFSKKGAKSDHVEAFIPYSNSAVQGVRRFGQQWAKHPFRTTTAATTLILLPKLWESAKFGNDPDYQKLPARTRYRNLILHKNADGTFVQLPMPPEYEALGAMAGDALTKYKDGNPVQWGDAADAILNAYTPPWVSGATQGATQGGGFDKGVVGALNSTVVGPPAGYAYNQSWNGSPIVPQRLQGNSPYMQKDERTSSLASWAASTTIGKKLGLSPLKLDYLAKQYGGDLARLGLPQFTDMGGGSKVESLLSKFIVDPTFTNNLSRDYYNRLQQVTQTISDVGDGATSPAWLTDDVKKLATSRAKGSPLKTLTELSAEKRSIQGDKLLSSNEKSMKLRENQRKINNIYLDVTSRLEKMGVPK